MENYKKEKCSKQHLKIDLGQDHSQDIFMLANPMTYGDVTTPTSPPNYSIPSLSNPNTPTNPTPTHSSGGSSTFTRGVERWSLKSKNKSQSFFKRFGRSSSGGGGGGMIIHKDGEEDGSSGSEHEDPFSPNSSAGAGDLIPPHRQMSEPPKSPSSNVEHYTRQSGRHHSGGHSSRDSGFSSERESVSLLKDDSVTTQSNNMDDMRLSPPDLEEYRPAGMEALEILHNQLKLLAKADTDEDTDSVCVYEQVIANLSKQLEDQSLSLDVLRQSEANLKLSLRLSQQRAVEAETKLVYAAERCLNVERKYVSLTSRYKSLRRKHAGEESSSLQRHSMIERKRHSVKKTSPCSSLHSSGSPHQQHTPTDDRIPPQRVQSQTLYDRQNKWEQNGTRRPNTAQGFHHDQNNVVASITSLSHTETSV